MVAIPDTGAVYYLRAWHKCDQERLKKKPTTTKKTKKTIKNKNETKRTP